MERLSDAAGTQRVFRPRLTGSFRHGACEAPVDSTLVRGALCGSPLEQARARRTRVLSLGPAVLDLQLSDPGPESDRIAALWTAFAATEPGDFRRAASDMERAARAGEPSPDFWSDVAALNLVVADAVDDPSAIVDALEAANRALALDPFHLAGRFNRALALDLLQLRDAAARAWTAYLDVDQSTEWATEAEAYREEAAQPRYDWGLGRTELVDAVERGDAERAITLGRRYAAEAETYAVESLLPRWGTAYESGSRQAADSLWHLAVAIDSLVSPVVEGSVLRGVVGAMRRDVEGGPDERTALHARALSAFREGLAGMSTSLDGAEDAFTRAREGFAGLGSPMTLVADHWLADVAFLRSDDERSIEITRRVLEASPTPNHWAALAHRRLGVLAGTGARYSERRDRALELVRVTDPTDRVLLARAYSDVAYATLTLSGVPDAWPPTYRALTTLRDVDDLRATNTVLSRTAELVASRGDPDVVLTIQNEVVDAARSDGSPAQLASVLRRRAEFQLAAGRVGRAQVDVSEADSLVRSLPGTEERSLVESDLRLVRGEILAEEAPGQAVEDLTAVVRTFTAEGYSLMLARAYLALARAHAALGHRAEGMAALASAIDEIEREGALTEAADRVAIRDRARPIFERLVLQRVESGNAEGALTDFEAMRTRVALDGTPDTGPVDLARLRQRLAPGTAVLSFAVLEERLLVWLVQSGSVELVTVPTGAADVRGLVEDFRSAVLTGQNREALQVGERLHDLLIAPIAARHPLPNRVVIVPDRALHYLPFAALRDPETGRYLIEDHEIVMAPSIRDHVRALERYRALARSSDRRVLAVGDPAFPRDAYGASPLPFSEAEARAVASEWPSSSLLLGADATREAFLRAAAGADVVHFAGHAVLRPESPLDSFLLLAAGDGSAEDAQLRGRDLLGLELPRTSLVVLSACATSDGRLSETEGAISLARSFLGAGVPGVVSSLWAVEDRSTAAFFTAFHAELAHGRSPPAALRTAQLALVGGEGGPERDLATWAAFQFIGGA